MHKKYTHITHTRTHKHTHPSSYACTRSHTATHTGTHASPCTPPCFHAPTHTHTWQNIHPLPHPCICAHPPDPSVTLILRGPSNVTLVWIRPTCAYQRSMVGGLGARRPARAALPQRIPAPAPVGWEAPGLREAGWIGPTCGAKPYLSRSRFILSPCVSRPIER